ncbi:fructuronate reductase [Friedmanniella endophytica]|uniref:Mannitol-1-phosphate 5-dehydrogenase n=1 Tax=Microlunatus kandeliicorticis TaxID=1759536 RepID=A0A7W3P6C0_9ACTN|nr:mannitol dehydrogenase family protein [Microlunatus kandeliicorticis]MBA8794819.1 fructuronate reductase [Microlunatus kandeliicorticis]
MTAPRLDRDAPGRPTAPPVRIVHLGVGNFHRAHQAWYTAHAADADGWGIAGFTGRRPDAAEALGPQDGLYTLIVRGPDGDAFELVGSLAAVHPAADHAALLDYLRRPEVAVVTLTVTEAGYLRGADGRLDLERAEVQADLETLRTDAGAAVTTVPGRLVAGLAARRAAGAGPLTVLSCDNLPENGAATAAVVGDLARALDPGLADWIAAEIDFATSMVDRITPATTAEDVDLVARSQGWTDAAPVPTEPFAEWVVAGRFPAGRPDWAGAGVALVDDVTPYEQRKLWLLNGSHSLLAYAASQRGHRTIDAAIADPVARGWVETYWDEAVGHLSLPGDQVSAYRAALLDRFGNPRVRHQLAQIAADGSLKLAVRIVPVTRAERAAGRLPTGCSTALAGWVRHLQGHGVPVTDPNADRAQEAASAADPRAAVHGVLATLADDLAADEAFVDLVVARLDALTA